VTRSSFVATTALAWGLDEGRIEGVDVTGLGVALSAVELGFEPKWSATIYVDERATPMQHDALLKLVTGQLGGGFVHLAALIGEVRSIERAPIVIDVDQHHAQLSVGNPVPLSS
jgi:hypothetical protein